MQTVEVSQLKRSVRDKQDKHLNEIADQIESILKENNLNTEG